MSDVNHLQRREVGADSRADGTATIGRRCGVLGLALNKHPLQQCRIRPTFTRADEDGKQNFAVLRAGKQKRKADVAGTRLWVLGRSRTGRNITRRYFGERVDLAFDSCRGARRQDAVPDLNVKDLTVKNNSVSKQLRAVERTDGIPSEHVARNMISNSLHGKSEKLGVEANEAGLHGPILRCQESDSIRIRMGNNESTRLDSAVRRQ
ncbi:hypothetical protein B0H14DRAFT_2578320 [Mycena olivaceomarginata]|nr:hypothetical protein B0H14DRAFT_2578320 [Mycena olivaceomarginata]